MTEVSKVGVGVLSRILRVVSQRMSFQWVNNVNGMPVLWNQKWDWSYHHYGTTQHLLLHYVE